MAVDGVEPGPSVWEGYGVCAALSYIEYSLSSFVCINSQELPILQVLCCVRLYFVLTQAVDVPRTEYKAGRAAS